MAADKTTMGRMAPARKEKPPDLCKDPGGFHSKKPVWRPESGMALLAGEAFLIIGACRSLAAIHLAHMGDSDGGGRAVFGTGFRALD